VGRREEEKKTGRGERGKKDQKRGGKVADIRPSRIQKKNKKTETKLV